MLRAVLVALAAQAVSAEQLHLQPQQRAQLGSAATPAPPSLLPKDLGTCAPPGCCNISLVGTTLRVCATRTCVSLPDVQLPGINTTVCLTPAAADCANNQTLAMVDASGVKFGGALGLMHRVLSELLSFLSGKPALSVFDFLAYPLTQGDPPALGDFERCKAAPSDTRFCLYTAPGFVRAGACMPPQCTPAAQKQVFLAQNQVYQMIAKVLALFPATQPLAGPMSAVAGMQNASAQTATISCGGIQRRVSGEGSHSETSSSLGKGFTGDSGAIAVASIIVVIFCLNVISTAALWLRREIRAYKAEQERARLLAQASDEGSGSESQGITDTEAAASPMRARLPAPQAESDRPQGVWALLKCFDLVESRRQFLRISPRRATSFLNGMRVISIAWVVLGHVLVYPMPPGFDNMSELERDYLPNFRMIFLASAFYAVDTFFFMSGFLACYSFTDENKGWKARLPDGGALKTVGATLMVYVDRYIRLTPAYLFLIFFAAYLLQYFGTGPLWAMAMDGGDVAHACSRYWYSNILYINNFPKYTDDAEKQCFGHSWYLANDMQFLIIGTPIMILYTHHEAAAWLVTVALMLTSFGLIIGKEHDPSQAPTGGQGYMRPYIRVAPYLYGLTACYVIRSHGKAILLKMSNAVTRWIVYSIAFCLMFGGMVWQWQSWQSCGGLIECGMPQKPDWAHQWTPEMTRAFSWYYHFAWGLGLAMLTVVWTVGTEQKLGGWVVDFLSYPVFEPMYRLTYGVYLIHPMVLLCMKMTDVRQNHYTDYWLMTYWIAATVGSYLASVLLHFFIERPCSLLWDLASGRSRRRSKRPRELAPQPAASVKPAEADKPAVEPSAAATRP